MTGALGRRVPNNGFEHVLKYPLTAETTPSIPTPVVIGVNWYTEFDTPQKDSSGHWWIARDGKLTSVRGGHCICLKPPSPLVDGAGWWSFYDQGHEGACVGFGSSRMMTLLNRRRYDARWLWNQAKIGDGFPDTNPGDDNGTTVHAALDVLRTQGHVRWNTTTPNPSDGISANRWATSVDDVLNVLGTPGRDYCEILNSWGHDGYPHFTRIPAEVLARLLSEDGEFGLVTDR